LLAVMLASGSFAGCGDSGDNDGDETEQTVKPVAGTFVGKVAKSDALVSVVVAEDTKGEETRAVTVYACDARRPCDLLSGSAIGNEFTASAEAGEGGAEGTLRRAAATGSIQLGGEGMRFSADRATAAAGVYDLTVSANGKIRGVSAAGVALTGTSTLPEPGRGTLKLADGSRLMFKTTRTSADAGALQAGQVRLIVLPNGQIRGVGKNRTDESVFFVRSLSG
jgi:hypothetical protein